MNIVVIHFNKMSQLAIFYRIMNLSIFLEYLLLLFAFVLLVLSE